MQIYDKYWLLHNWFLCSIKPDFDAEKNDLNVLYKHRPSVTAIAAAYLLSDRALLLFCIAASVRLFKDPVLGART